MDISIPIVFLILAIIFFILALFEEREEADNEDDEEKKDHLVVLMMGLAVGFFFIGGVCMMYVTNTYYSPITDDITESPPITSYQPLGWIGIGTGFVALIMLISKCFDILDYGVQEGV